MPNKTIEKKGENWRKGYQSGYEEASKAFGGCTKCYGKGYSTSLQFAESRLGRYKLPVMKFCQCGRGKQLRKLLPTNKQN